MDSPQSPKLVEKHREGFTVVWMCDPPPVGEPYQVLREEWHEVLERTIYEIEVERG